jgi:PAS domain S-box-containing protein
MGMHVLPEFDLEGFSARLMPGQIAPALFQALPDVFFWIKDEAGRFVYTNKAFCHEVAEDDVSGMRDEDIFPPELAQNYQQGDEEVLATGEAFWNKLELIPTRAGGVEWRSTSKIPLKDVDGSWVGTAGVSRRMGLVEGLPMPTRHHKLAVIVAAIYQHLEKGVSIAELAQAAAVSMSTLERLFKEHMNTTPRRFIIQVKMSAACERLINTGMQVKEIASSVGYDEHANFTRAFTKEMGMSPRSYQKFYKKG